MFIYEDILVHIIYHLLEFKPYPSVPILLQSLNSAVITLNNLERANLGIMLPDNYMEIPFTNKLLFKMIYSRLGIKEIQGDGENAYDYLRNGDYIKLKHSKYCHDNDYPIDLICWRHYDIYYHHNDNVTEIGKKKYTGKPMRDGRYLAIYNSSKNEVILFTDNMDNYIVTESHTMFILSIHDTNIGPLLKSQTQVYSLNGNKWEYKSTLDDKIIVTKSGFAHIIDDCVIREDFNFNITLKIKIKDVDNLISHNDVIFVTSNHHLYVIGTELMSVIPYCWHVINVGNNMFKNNINNIMDYYGNIVKKMNNSYSQITVDE